MDRSTCRVCGEKLNESQRVVINGMNYKSCPNCSSENGSEHVYYPDELFGFSDKRETEKNSDGIQSHCTPCRGDELNDTPKVFCRQIIR